MSEKKTFDVHVEQGMKAGSKITLRGEAGCSEPGLAPGDVVLVIAPKEHATFKRVNIDLVMQVGGWGKRDVWWLQITGLRCGDTGRAGGKAIK